MDDDDKIIISKYEYISLVIHRVRELSTGSHPMVELEYTEDDNVKIACDEINQGVLAYVITRKYPNGVIKTYKNQDVDISAVKTLFS